MKSNLNYLPVALATGAMVLLSAPSAYAVLILTLDDPSTVGVDVTVADGNADGIVVFNGSFGVWTLSVTTGLSKPLVGSDLHPIMDLNTISVSSGAGTLLLSLTDSFATAAAGDVISDIGGTIWSGGGSLAAAVSTNPGGPTGAAHNFVLPGAFSGTSTGSAPAAPYDLNLSAELVHVGAGHSSFDWDVSVQDVSVPDGGDSIMLLGLSLLGLAGVRRKLLKA